jgi:hypothetical protein
MNRNAILRRLYEICRLKVIKKKRIKTNFSTSHEPYFASNYFQKIEVLFISLGPACVGVYMRFI